jgi:two-component system response regulator
MTNGVILLVEDSPMDEELTKRALALAKIANEIVVARDGVEALDFLFGRGAHSGRDATDVPAVVLLDLKLPRVDGLGVLREIRSNERTKLVPVIMLTSSNEESDRLASYGLGANSFVRKPVEFAAFASAVADLGRYWLVVNEPPPPT